MIQVRRNVFETNSSSTHSITICMEEDYNRWQKGELYLNNHYGGTSAYKDLKFVTKEQLLDIVKNDKWMEKYYEDLTTMDDQEEFDSFVSDWDFYTADNYENSGMEWFEESFTTPSGDAVVAFGQYGYDG